MRSEERREDELARERERERWGAGGSGRTIVWMEPADGEVLGVLVAITLGTRVGLAVGEVDG